MAAWQFYLEAIPRKELIDVLGFMPQKMSLNFDDAEKMSSEEWEKIYQKHVDLRKRCWFPYNIAPSEIILDIDKCVKRASWSSDSHLSWKTFSKQVDNDAALLINEENGKIEHLSFRADLREKGVVFLKNMAQLAEKFDWLLMDNKGNIVEPIYSEIKPLILISYAYKVVTDPENY
jgi:hypothetical protein